MKNRIVAFALTALFFSVDCATAESKDESLPADLSTVGLDALLNMDLVVTLPGRKEQKASEAGSAVYVISQDDIRRSGATHVAELLRLVPGVNVARISSDRWAISVRGFNQAYANKLLVLIDGVSVFSPTTNGVYWESNELVLEDIERIEVVRGPGGALWGSNAVNGVINIITKKAGETKGTLASVGGGTFEKVFTNLRYGDSVGESSAYRVYGTFHNRGENRLADGGDAEDDWQSGAGGFRFDGKPSKDDSLTLLSDFQFQNDDLLPAVPSLEPPYIDNTRYLGSASYRGIRSSAEWTHSLSTDSEVQALLSYSRKDRNTKLFSFQYDIINLDLQHRYKVTDYHEFVYGGGFRHFKNDADDTLGQMMDPKHRETDLSSAFLQDDYTAIPDRLHFIAGIKYEHNEHTGNEYMPNGRIVYTPDSETTIWASVSRAVAPPAIFFEDSTFPFASFPIEGVPLTGVAMLTGSRDLDSEELIAYEVGFRRALSKSVSLDIASYYNSYDDIFSGEEREPFVGSAIDENAPAFIVPIVFDNRLSGRAIGGEAAIEWKPSETLKFTGYYAVENISIDLGDSTDVPDIDLLEGASPRNQAGLRAHLALSDTVSFDNFLRYVDHLSFNDVPAYIELDSRLAWQVSKSTELSLVGTNLLHNDHEEFQSNLFGPPATNIRRAVFGMIRINF